MDKELKKALTELTEGADPGRVENAVRERICREAECAVKPRRHTGGYRYPVRAVLAAVLVFVLAGSVYAAVQVQKRLTVTLPEDGPYDIVMQIPGQTDTEQENAGGIIGMIQEKRREFEDAVRKDPMLTLPEEKRKELQAHVVTQEDIQNGTYAEKCGRFDTWEEAAAWLDCGLLTSDLLITSDLLTAREMPWSKDLGQPWGNVDLVVNGDVYPTMGEYTSISLSGTVHCPLLAENEYARLNVRIPLSGDWESYGQVVTYMTGKMYESEDAWMADMENHEKTSTDGSVIPYTTATGIQTEIAVLTVPRMNAVLENGRAVGTELTDSIRVHLFFLHEGILYELEFSAPDAESGIETAKAIAESMK